MLAAFLRNDGNPALATAGVLIGGIFNVFGDYFFVFTCDMGIFGAGLATAIGSVISFGVMLSNFLSRKNTLRFIKPEKLFVQLKEISVSGFSSFFIDVAMGILTVLFNRQIMKYLGGVALAVYGPIINISTLVQCCAYSVGQAALSISCQNLYIRIFMDATENIFIIAPAIIRTYSVSFLLLPLNIFSTYYFQAIMQPKAAFVVSVMRGLVISGALILILPAAFPADSIWLAMPVTELLTAVYAVFAIKKYTKALSEE